MKEDNKFKDLSLEELQKKRKRFKIIVTVLGILMLFLLADFIYSVIKNKSLSSATSLGGFPLVLLLSANYLKKIETEIKSRNSQL
jgi:hypothetical protein